MRDDADRELIKRLIDWSGKSASDLARGAGLTPSTLTRPLNKSVKHRLSMPTLEKLEATQNQVDSNARIANENRRIDEAQWNWTRNHVHHN